MTIDKISDELYELADVMASKAQIIARGNRITIAEAMAAMQLSIDAKKAEALDKIAKSTELLML